MAEETENDFGDDEAGVEHDADGKGAAKIGFVVVALTHRKNWRLSLDNRTKKTKVTKSISKIILAAAARERARSPPRHPR